MIRKIRHSRKGTNSASLSFNQLHEAVLMMMSVHDAAISLHDAIVELNGFIENLDCRCWMQEHEELVNDAKYFESVYGFCLKKVFVPFAMNLLQSEFSHVKHTEVTAEQLKEILNIKDEDGK